MRWLTDAIFGLDEENETLLWPGRFFIETVACFPTARVETVLSKEGAFVSAQAVCAKPLTKIKNIEKNTKVLQERTPIKGGRGEIF
ncbi:MAG: hypothetical protein IJ733_18160 [Lachnospiraceae bacterium]|nr:hypothetical protein [Lachnospiraceae bacterium]